MFNAVTGSYPKMMVFGPLNTSKEIFKDTHVKKRSMIKKVELPENKNAIIFRIKNYTSRSIYKIYGRVISINKEGKNLSKKFVLLNNPHQGGNIVKGNPHRPGTVSEWNFKLIRKPSQEAQDINYTLQVHPRSIFFVNVEPPKIKEKKP